MAGWAGWTGAGIRGLEQAAWVGAAGRGGGEGCLCGAVLSRAGGVAAAPAAQACAVPAGLGLRVCLCQTAAHGCVTLPVWQVNGWATQMRVLLVGAAAELQLAQEVTQLPGMRACWHLHSLRGRLAAQGGLSGHALRLQLLSGLRGMVGPSARSPGARRLPTPAPGLVQP